MQQREARAVVAEMLLLCFGEKIKASPAKFTLLSSSGSSAFLASE
jgi:hypothetical protein